jgi:hypothetical protein
VAIADASFLQIRFSKQQPRAALVRRRARRGVSIGRAVCQSINSKTAGLAFYCLRNLFGRRTGEVQRQLDAVRHFVFKLSFLNVEIFAVDAEVRVHDQQIALQIRQARA